MHKVKLKKNNGKINFVLVKQVSHCETKSDDMEACSEALYLLATTVDGVESWLWPCLISALLDSACVASVRNSSIHRVLNLTSTSDYCRSLGP